MKDYEPALEEWRKIDLLQRDKMCKRLRHYADVCRDSQPYGNLTPMENAYRIAIKLLRSIGAPRHDVECKCGTKSTDLCDDNCARCGGLHMEEKEYCESCSKAYNIYNMSYHNYDGIFLCKKCYPSEGPIDEDLNPPPC